MKTATSLTNSIKQGISRLTLGATLLLAIPVMAQANVSTITIESQELNSALLELAQETSTQIIFSPELVKDLQADAVSGEMTVVEAVSALLQRSALEFQQVSERTIIIKSADDAKVAVSPDASAVTTILAPASSDDSQESTDDNTDAPTDAPEQPLTSPALREGDNKLIEELVVTGTRLNGVSPSSPILVLDAEELQRRGLSSAEEIARFLPQNYSTITSGAAFDRSVSSSFQGAVTANLRGLGEGSTLILINGKRIPSSPTERGTFTDISTIPISSIERVEVLTDGASAVYGSDAVGGVINIILRSDYRGSSSKVRFENSSSGFISLYFC